jgi:transmembrane sensor
MTPPAMNGERDRLETASDWLLRMQAEPLGEQELAEWLRWYDADPANRAAFERIQATFESLHALPGDQRREWAIELRGGRPGSSSHFRWPAWLTPKLAFAGAAAFAIALASVYAFLELAGEDRRLQAAAFTTERAAHRDLVLPDGSRVGLGAKSQLSTNFTPQVRYLVLEGGEAYFEVAKDPERPFVVQAGAITIRATGTQFNVRRVMDQTIVVVTEGTVEVTRHATEPKVRVSRLAQPDDSRTSITRLGAGEQAIVGATMAALSIKRVEPDSAAAWRHGRLEFLDEPLPLVIATINRYSERNVVITDAALNNLTFTGTVARDRIEEWLMALADIYPLQVSRAGSEAVLLSKKAQ